MVILVMSGDPGSIIDREQCGKTVDSMDLFNRASLPPDHTALKCPTVTITIEDKDNEKNNEKMANAMYDCATQFRRGNKQLFTDDGVYCNVCYIFDVKEQVDGFYGYLLKNTVPDLSGETYHEYMQGFRTVRAKKVITKMKEEVTTGELSEWETIIPNPQQPAAPLGIILPNTQQTAAPLGKIEAVELSEGRYAVIFIYARGQEHFKKVWRHVTAQTTYGKVGLAAGGVSFLTFAGSGVAAAYLIPVATTGPVGWVIIGTGVVLGAAAYAGAETITWYLSRDTPPDHAAFFVFRQWNPYNGPDGQRSAAELLAEDIGCEYVV